MEKVNFWKTALALWVLALCGTLLLLPYLTTLTMAEAAERTGKPLAQLLIFSAAQSAVLLAIAVLVGLWAARKLGLQTPLISAVIGRKPAPDGTRVTFALAFALGIVTALVLGAVDHWVFAPIPSVAALIEKATTGATRPSAWQGLLASFYGGLDEEILMRLGLMSVLALVFRTVARKMRLTDPDYVLPAGVFWTANIIAAIVFGLAHLPVTAALAPLSTALVIRAVVLNGVIGFVCGVMFRRYGLEWGMASHFGFDLMAHVAFA